MQDAGASPHVPGAAAAPPLGERDRIIDAAFRLIAQTGWRHLSMAAIAAEAEVPIVSLYRSAASRPAILCAFFRRIDEVVLAVPVVAEPGERPRDRLFDLLMRRFDALQPYRGALEVLRRELPADPPAAVVAGAALLHSMRWMIEAAGTAADGLSGAVAVNLTAAAYFSTLRVWSRDTTPDLAPTMAELDRRLRGIERWLERGQRRRPDSGGAATAAP